MSEQYKVIYSPQAADDLKDIYSYSAFELSVRIQISSHASNITSPVTEYNIPSIL